ncbi:PREDICTED: aspartic proteinase-like protein 2 [Nelumbo nucifera]|uniref:Aspartic proteinase-like protein 2 n=1 Tax=Nelumbo nucifera TaxID=4432 RepID=A0A1U7Z9G4_NELNU|nr:PREDICTED: aspartic proteinase-like protein 2 [Nelumbo nucifera]
MPAFHHAGSVVLVLFAVFLPAAVVYSSLPTTLTLERAFPVNKRVELSELIARDRVRHRRILQGIVDFPVEGTYNPYTVGLYFTRVKLGTPPKEFFVQIDTGSDVLWVTCNPCNGCPKESGLNIALNFFDPSASSTASLVSCSDKICNLALQTADGGCSSQNSQCSYTFQYGDGSGTTGYYVSDMLSLEAVLGNSLVANSSAPIIFGCSNYQSGDLTKPDRAVDGIFGFGQHDLSVISQLSSRGITPKIFSHCLIGANSGGGVLVFGEIVEPNIVYSPLVPNQPHYNLNLQSIAVNGQILPIDPAVFATSSNRGTIIDSGTTLAYLAAEAYDPFVSAISSFISQSTHLVFSKENQCYLISSSVDEIFPTVSLNFAGSASMILSPVEYLIKEGGVDGAEFWCIGFQRVQDPGMTILGDLVLRDKIFVYDLVNQQIGWANYDCSLSVNVSTISGKDQFVNTGQLSVSSSSQTIPYKLLSTSTVAFLVYIYIFDLFMFL